MKLLLAIGGTGLILAIAVPNYFGGRIARLEDAATSELHTIHLAQRQFLAQHGRYSATLTALDPARGGTQHGYTFTMAPTESGFTASAHPKPYYGFSRRTLHIDQTGAVTHTWSDVQSEEIK